MWKKTKAMETNKTRRRGSGEILTINNHEIKVVRSFEYLGTVLNNSNIETKEIKDRILAANTAYYSANYI
jgi:hypothetical protein